MRITGVIEYNSKEKVPFYIGLPELGIHTQGENLENAYFMIKDALGLMMDDFTDGKVTSENFVVYSKDNVSFEIGTNKIKEFSAFIIHRLRMFSDLSQEEVVSNMGKKSRNSLTTYEYGKSEAGLSKFNEIISAMGLDFNLSIIHKNKIA